MARMRVACRDCRNVRGGGGGYQRPLSKGHSSGMKSCLKTRGKMIKLSSPSSEIVREPLSVLIA